MSKLVTQFEIHQTDGRNRVRQLRGSVNYTVTEMHKREVVMQPGDKVEGVTKTVMHLYAQNPVTVTLTVGEDDEATSIVLPGVRGFMALPAAVSFEINYVSGAPFTLRLLHD